MELPKQIADFIAREIKLTNYCLPHFYPTLESFNTFQAGYKFNSLTGEKLTGDAPGDFKESWVVICSAYADDPFFVDLTESAKNYPVYFAWHAAGDWAPLKVADSIAEFSNNLNLLKLIEAEGENIQTEIEKNFDMNSEFWKEVYDEYTEYED
jgi:hypothetical protein